MWSELNIPLLRKEEKEGEKGITTGQRTDGGDEMDQERNTTSDQIINIQ